MSTVRQISMKLLPESGAADSDDEHLAVLDGWVIGTLVEIAEAWDWDCLKRKETITTVPSQAEYSLAIEAARIVFARIPENDIVLDLVDEQDLKNCGYNLELEGTLMAIYYSGYDTATKQDKIKFYYIPSTAEDVEIEERLRIDEETLTADSEIPFPPDFNELIKLGVRRFIADYRLKFQSMRDYTQRFQAMLEEKKSNKSFQLGERLIRGVSDIPQRTNTPGLRRDPAHYRNDIY